ncbi:EamA family transporter [bacterium]|nr:MAG: EamA family transporter [bacterium]
MDYRVWALFSALAAGATAVLAKKGVEEVPSNLALAVRVAFVFVFASLVAVMTKQTKVGDISPRAWGFLAASAVGTGLSWLCYFRALSMGPVSKVAPVDKLSFVVAMVLGVVFLGETVGLKVMVGAGLIVVGVLVTLS